MLLLIYAPFKKSKESISSINITTKIAKYPIETIHTLYMGIKAEITGPTSY